MIDDLIAPGYAGLADALEAKDAELAAKCKECSELKIELAKWVNFWRDKDNKALQARILELEAALKQSHDVMHELMAIIPGNDKGAIEATANAMRAASAAYRGEKE